MTRIDDDDLELIRNKTDRDIWLAILEELMGIEEKLDVIVKNTKK